MNKSGSTKIDKNDDGIVNLFKAVTEVEDTDCPNPFSKKSLMEL